MVIFRNDDISPSTDFTETRRQYDVVRDCVKNVEIWHGITLFGKRNENGSVYEETPFKDKVTSWFYDVDSAYRNNLWSSHVKHCSHGLFHVDHSKISTDAQEMSIVGSCRVLKVDTFIPPFNRYNGETRIICKNNDIHLVTRTGWKNLKYNDFDPKHRLWYWHSWEWSAKSLKGKLCINQ